VKNLAKNGAALALGVLLSALVLELGLRLLNPFELRVRGNRIVLRTNAEWTLSMPPESQLDLEIVHRKNNIGFRGRDFDRSEGALRAFALGGSTTECILLTEGKTWPDRLQAKLAPDFPRFWLNNAGFDGHSTFGNRILLDDHVSEYEPDLLIFLVGINDLGLEDLNASEREMLALFSNRSEAVNLAVSLYRSYRARKRGIGHNVEGLRENWLVDWEIDGETIEAHLSYLEKGKQEFHARLTGLLDSARKLGAEVVLVTQPALYGPGTDDRTGLDLGRIAVSGVDGSTAWMMLESYNDVTRAVTRAVARSEGVHLIDLATLLPKSSHYFYDTIHFTNEGAERVAGILHEGLCPYLAERFPDEAVGACETPADMDSRRGLSAR
jgi:lysophospholipase L1-like esterase